MRADTYDEPTIVAILQMLTDVSFFHDGEDIWIAIDHSYHGMSPGTPSWRYFEGEDRLLYEPLSDDEFAAIMTDFDLYAVDPLTVYSVAKPLFIAALRGHGQPANAMPPPGPMTL